MVGRGRRKKLGQNQAYSNWFCKHNVVESEFHLLAECTFYSSLRCKLFQSGKDEAKGFDVMSTENYYLLREVAKYAQATFAIRQISLKSEFIDSYFLLFFSFFM